MNFQKHPSHTKDSPGKSEMRRLISEMGPGQLTSGSSDELSAFKIAIYTLLDSSLPSVLLWGPDQLCYYNDAFCFSLGENQTNRPCLGGGIKDGHKDLWHLIEAAYVDVLRTGEGLVQKGIVISFFHDEGSQGKWDVSYNPWRDAEGAPRGLILTFIKTRITSSVEEQLEYQKRLLETVTDNTDMALFLMDKNQYCVYMNSRAEEMTGFTLEELKGKQLHYHIHHSHPDGSFFPLEECPIDQALPTRMRMKGEDVFVHKNGDFYPVAYTASPIIIDGTATGTVIEVRETTEEKRQQQALLESEKKYRRLLESNIVGVLFWDMDKGITDANDSFLNLIGFTREEVAEGVHWNDITPPKWRQQDESSLSELITTGKNLPFEKQYIHKDGRTIDVLIANTALEETENRQGVTFVLDISDRKRTESELRESENRFRTIANDAPAFIFIANANAQIEFINESWINFTGLSQEDALGQGWATVTHPDDLQRSFDIYNEAFKTHTPYQYEMQQRGVDGEYHWILWQGIPRLLADGEFLGILGFGFDITERKRSEESLEKSEELFRNFSNNIQNLAWIADGEGSIYWYNQRWYDYTGTSLEEMQGWGWEKVHHRDHIKRVIAFLNEAWLQDQPWELTFPLRNVNGEYQWFLTRAVPIKDKEGKVCRWIGTNTNVNDQKLLAERLEDLVSIRTAELTKSTAFLQSVLNSAQTTISSFEAIRDEHNVIVDFRFTYANNPLIVEPGEAAGKLVGKTCKEAIPRIFSSGEFEEFVKCVETGQVAQYETHYNHNGQINWYFVSLAKMGDGLTTTSLNITKEKEAAQQLASLNMELDKRNHQLQRSNEDLQQFAHVASHDLKEPVRKIRTFSSRLKDEFQGLLPEKGIQYLSRIEKGADRMYDMIDGVLLYSSIDSRQQTTEEIQLNEIWLDIKSDLELVIAQKNAVIESDNLPFVEGVPILIYQLFYNLVNNALKFAKTDEQPVIKLSVSGVTREDKHALKLNDKQNFIKIILKDNGIGFDQDAAEKVFQPFSRLNTKDKYEGTGLGLSLCRKIAERHGGKIWAEGNPGVGASFFVVLPLFEK